MWGELIAVIIVISFIGAVHKRRTHSFVVRAAVVDTDSWDSERRREAERAWVDSPAVDADNDVDSCWVDTAAVPVIVDKLELQDPSKVGQVDQEGSFQELDLTPAADSLDWAAMSAALRLRKQAVRRMEMVMELAESQLVDWATSLEIADSIDCY